MPWGVVSVDEAHMQGNCLVNARYVEKYMAGESDLVFMRDKKNPDQSFVTIEVINGRITQAYLAGNKIPGKELYDVIYKWIASVER